MKIHAIVKVRYSISVFFYIINGGYIMAYVLTASCVKCGSCADNCPVEAISEGDEQYVIDADVCVNCGTCAANCPVEAIEDG